MPAIRGKVIPEHVLQLMPKADRKALGKAGLTMTEASAKTAVKLERELHHQIEGYLALREIVYDHDRMDKKRTGTLGWPDFTFAVNSVPAAIEAKAPGGKLDPEQERVIGEMLRNGWRVAVVDNLGAVVDFIRFIETTKD